MRDDDEWDRWFEDLFTAHARTLHRYFARRAAADDVQDLAAEVFATAWRRREDVPAEAELPWLYRTAGFVLANHRRKGRPVPVEDVPEHVDDADPAHLVLADDEMRRALSRLSVRDRRILVLNAWEGLTGADLADVLGISRGGADAALSRARARLRDAWATAEGSGADGAADAAVTVAGDARHPGASEDGAATHAR